MVISIHTLLKEVYIRNNFIDLLQINIKNTFEIKDFKISFKDSKIYIRLIGGYPYYSSYKTCDILTYILEECFERCDINYVTINYSHYFNEDDIIYEANLSIDTDKLLDRLRIKLHNNDKLLEEVFNLI